MIIITITIIIHTYVPIKIYIFIHFLSVINSQVANYIVAWVLTQKLHPQPLIKQKQTMGFWPSWVRKVLTWVSIFFGPRAQGFRGANDFAAQNHWFLCCWSLTHASRYVISIINHCFMRMRSTWDQPCAVIRCCSSRRGVGKARLRRCASVFHMCHREGSPDPATSIFPVCATPNPPSFSCVSTHFPIK